MAKATRRVVLFGCDSGFFEFAAFHLAAAGLETVPVVNSSALGATVRDVRPCAVLLHWDTLGESSWRACALVKANNMMRAPLIVLAERLNGGPNIMATFASGADGLIEGALNPRILLSRLRGYVTDLVEQEQVSVAASAS